MSPCAKLLSVAEASNRAGGAAMSEQSRRYDRAAAEALAFRGDSHFPVLAEVPGGMHVLELGTSTGYMSRALVERACTVVGVEYDPGAAELAAAHCERMIVGDLDDPELLDELADERFDLVLAADVLEHLKDPVAALRRAASYLRNDGHVIASLPNVTHVSVRLALLQGHFPYSSTGLLDRTHLRFFDREHAVELFEQAGLEVVRMVAHQVDAEDANVPFERDELAERILADAAADPDASAFQFIVIGRPSPDPERSPIGPRREHAARTNAAESECDELERSRGEIGRMSQALVASAQRGAESLELLRSAHEQLAQRDGALDELRLAFAELTRSFKELERNAQEDHAARAYFEAESRAAHRALDAVRDSRAWRLVVLMRRFKRLPAR